MGLKLCICIPTCNRSECINRVLKEELALLKEVGVDLWIYDSSSNNNTKQLTSEYQNKGFDNLLYKHVDFQIHPNIKAYQIFRDSENTDYDYVWMIHDHTFCNKLKTLKKILEALSEGYDFYLLNMQSKEYKIIEIQNLDEFLLLGAWPLNSFGASIIKVDTFIRGTDWQKISEKYLQKKTLNYSHIGFYFERASQIEDIKLCKLELPREAFLDFLRYEKTSWDGETIRICTECWGSNILGLPDVYKNKYQALQTQDRWFLSKYKLIFYKKSGQLGVKSFFKYSRWFRVIARENYWRDMLIAVFPFQISTYLYCRKLTLKVKKAQKRKQKVLIYGAGRHAVECADLLKNIGLDFDAFIVTDLNGNPDTLLGYPVYEAGKFLKNREALVLVAILTSGIAEVESSLKRIGKRNSGLDYMLFE